MVDDPLNVVHALVERAYIRLQAGDVLIRCLEEGSAAPIHQMVEGFVIAGPQSLEALREILSEVGQRKAQVFDDLNQIFSELQNNLKSYGVQIIDEVKDSLGVLGLTPVRFLSLLREQGIDNEEAQIACLHLLHNSRDLMSGLANHFQLLQEIERYLEDWTWGLAYQSARLAAKNPRPPSEPSLL